MLHDMDQIIKNQAAEIKALNSIVDDLKGQLKFLRDKEKQRQKYKKNKKKKTTKEIFNILPGGYRGA